MEEGILHLDESGARRLVLARAIDDADPQGKLLSEVEREQLEREAFEQSRPPSGALVPSHYLQLRATRVLAAVENRNPRIAALREPEPWRRWLAVLLPLALCAVGAAIDRIDNPGRVNMLSPPLLGVILWNLLAYALLAAGALLPRQWVPRLPLAAVQRWLAGTGVDRRTGRLRADVLARFHHHWLQAAGRLQALRARQLLHLCAAAWAVGLAISIVLGGVVREYRVGWESTLLDVRQVHGFLQVLFAPVVALLPFEPFSVADLQRMAFRSQQPVEVGEARRWIWMYVALLAVLVIVPRLLLAGAAGWQRRRAARAVRIDLRDPYYAQVLARVSPARVTLALVAPAGPGRDAVLRMLGEIADRPAPPPPDVWPVLATPRGDVLRFFDVPADFRPPAPVAAAQAAGAGPAQAWLQELLGRFRAPARARPPDPVQAALADTDLVLLAPGGLDDLEEATRLLHWVAQPALVLAPGDDAVYREAVRRLGLAADVLPLGAAAAHWACDAVLLEAALARVATSQRAGLERLAASWKERQDARFAEAMRLLAGELVRAARDSQEVGGATVNLRRLVSPEDREAAQRAREEARTLLLQRVHAGESAVLAQLVQLHRAGTSALPLPATRAQAGFAEQHTVDRPQAGMAGAATGAAMGAGIDLMTGGLTLGAAAALGAVIGGSAAYVAAAWKNRAAPGGQPQVQLGDELLQALTEGLLLAYLSVAHRVPDAAGWRSEVVAAVEARKATLEPLWQQARGAEDAAAVAEAMARALEDIARGLLARLRV